MMKAFVKENDQNQNRLLRANIKDEKRSQCSFHNGLQSVDCWGLLEILWHMKKVWAAILTSWWSGDHIGSIYDNIKILLCAMCADNIMNNLSRLPTRLFLPDKDCSQMRDRTCMFCSWRRSRRNLLVFWYISEVHSVQIDEYWLILTTWRSHFLSC